MITADTLPTGAALSVVGNFCISLGFQLQRIARNLHFTSTTQSLMKMLGIAESPDPIVGQPIFPREVLKPMPVEFEQAVAKASKPQVPLLIFGNGPYFGCCHSLR